MNLQLKIVFLCRALPELDVHECSPYGCTRHRGHQETSLVSPMAPPNTNAGFANLPENANKDLALTFGVG